MHTGETADEHGVFRLGDIDQCASKQIFEKIESRGYDVGSISAMNLKNNLQNLLFSFLTLGPDPGTDGSFYRQKYLAVSQAVNDNSKGEIKKSSIFGYLWRFF